MVSPLLPTPLPVADKEVNQGPDEVQEEDHHQPQQLLDQRPLLEQGINQHANPEDRSEQAEQPQAAHVDPEREQKAEW
jgi:hypothetical protein